MNIDEKLKEYLSMYGKYYPKEILDYINEYFYEDLEEKRSSYFINELYSKLGVYSEDEDHYLAYLNIMKKYFSFDCNILEIAGGFYPVMAEKVSSLQIPGKGSVTVYDPHLLFEKKDSLILKKQEFTKNDSMKVYDFCYGIMPCEATEVMVRKANSEKKPFFLGLCGCIAHLPLSLIYGATENRWFNYIGNVHDKTKDDECETTVEYLDNSYGIEYPILIKTYPKK